MQNHQPVLIHQAFPMAGTPDEQIDVQERLSLPRNPENCPLIVRIACGEEINAEVAALNDAGYAVYVCTADQRAMERDEAACAEWLAQLNEQLDGLFAEHPQLDAQELFLALKEEGIFVRYFNKPRIDQYLRITIGTDAQMDALITFLKDYRKNRS